MKSSDMEPSRKAAAPRQAREVAGGQRPARHAPREPEIGRDLQPAPDDWPLVAGDVAETIADIEWALRMLCARFATVIWLPGNHELWTLSADPVRLRGEARYRFLVAMCRRLG